MRGREVRDLMYAMVHFSWLRWGKFSPVTYRRSYLHMYSYYYYSFLNLLTTVVSPGEPPHHFSSLSRQRPDEKSDENSRCQGFLSIFLEQLFPLFQSTMAVFTFTDPDMRRSPMANNATNINLSINTELLILSGDNQSV